MTTSNGSSTILDRIPTSASALETTTVDYIIVGSGAGGAPLAARLALNGMRVLVLEAGGDPGAAKSGKDAENERVLYHCPGLHAASTEGERHGAPSESVINDDFFVRHYSDDNRQDSDSKGQSIDESSAERQLYPRAKALGGCTAHHAMIVVAPPAEDWQYIADLTGDASWRPESMRLLFRRIERFTRGRYWSHWGELWQRILDWWNPDQELAAHRGELGWLDISFTDPQLAVGDRSLLKMIKSAGTSVEAAGTWPLLRWILRFVRGRFYQDLDLNDPRTMSRAEGGVALLPLGVSAGRDKSRTTTAGMRRGPREFLLETRDALTDNANEERSETKENVRKSHLHGQLWIVTQVEVKRIVFRQEHSQGGPPQAVGVEVKIEGTSETQVCYARREIIVSCGAFGTPQLLMLSGIGDRHELDSRRILGPRNEQGNIVARIVDLPGVGKNLRDRYEISVVSEMKDDWSSLEQATFTLDKNDKTLQRWKSTRDGIYATNGGAIAILHKSQSRRDQEKHRDYLDRDTGEAPILAPDLFIMGYPAAFRGYYPGWSRDLLQSQKSGDSNPQRNLWSWTILKAFSHNAGEVRLDAQNPAGRPTIHFHYFEKQDAETGIWTFDETDSDLAALMEAVAVVRKVNCDAKPLFRDGNADSAELQPGRSRETGSSELRDWIVAETWGHHACGTCRIGQDDWQPTTAQLLDKQAVVDSRFRVHGVAGLRVVDASCFPKIPGYFLAAPVYMIAEKAADVLLAEPAGLPRELRAAEAEAIRTRRRRAFWQKESSLTSPPNDDSQVPTPPIDGPPLAPGAGPDDHALPEEAVGLALSGGGIRSATFCLGVLQSLAKKGRLRRIDYLSTVSGGGYIGAFLGCLAWRAGADGRNDPMHDVEATLQDERSPLTHWLRTKSNYLVSSGTSDWWQWITVYWRNLMAVYGVLLALGLALFGCLRFASDYIPLQRFIDWLAPSAAAQHGLLIESLLTLSPWWIVVAAWLWLCVLPSSAAYWISPHPGSYGLLSFFGMLFWIALCVSGLVMMILPEGFWIGIAMVLLLVLTLGYQFVRPTKLDGLERKSSAKILPFSSRATRNRLTRWMTFSTTYLVFGLGWVLIDTLARLVVMGTLPHLLTIWGVALAPFLPFIRKLSLPVSKVIPNGAPKRVDESLADMFPFSTLLLAIALLGFVVTTIDAVVLELYQIDWMWGAVATCIGLALSLAAGQAMEFLNGSSMSAIYTSRLTRTFLAASSRKRLDVASVNGLQNVLRYDRSDDVRFHRYRPDEAGGPLHLINICVNETVDVASQREISDRRSLPMCVSACGVSVGTRFHALWQPPSMEQAFPTVRFRRWLNGFETNQVQVLAAIPVSGDPFHVLGDRDGRPAFVELLTLGQWISISAAAVGTGNGRRSSKAASILAGIANARLGYWWSSGLPRRRREGVAQGNRFRQLARLGLRAFLMQYLLYSEWLGKFAGPSQEFWNLSDGGHFENSGIYELVRRRLPLIVAVDGGADPTNRLDDLGDLARQVRTDFGAEIEFLDLANPQSPLPVDLPLWINNWFHRPALGSLKSFAEGTHHAALARITWHDCPGQTAWLLYMKSSLSGDESCDVNSYKLGHSTFPSEPTTDQFFGEAQWESYRKLGQHVGETVLL